jgi:transcriptional regulator with XRE-family HTH domain
MRKQKPNKKRIKKMPIQPRLQVQVFSLRLFLGLTQKAFARQIGVSTITVSRIERGYIPKRTTCDRIDNLEKMNMEVGYAGHKKKIA